MQPGSHTAMRTAVALLLFAVPALSAHGQLAQSHIDSEGEATIEIAPDQAHFDLIKTFKGATLDDAADQALNFDQTVTQALRDVDLSPIARDPISLGLSRPPQVSAIATVGLAFTVSASEERVKQIRALTNTVERVRKLAVSLGCDVVFRGFSITDPETVEQEAVARATENALYHADAIGMLLNARVTGVERVTVIETAWLGTQPEDNVPIPVPPILRCHARVRVDYAYEATQSRR